MTRPCKVGVQLPEVERFVPWPEYLDLARRAEAVGFDSVWVGDHLVYDLPDGSTRGPYEAWTTLAAIAAVTERVEIGPLVASTGFHAPAMLAKQAATVDAISGGRLVLGLGAGWNRREFDAFGFAYDRRVSRFEEALAIIAPLLRDGRTTFHGRFYDVDDCVLDPRPPRESGPPIMVGSNSPRMLSIALPVVDSWNVWWSIYRNSVERFAEVKAEVDAAVPTGRQVEASAAVLVTLPGGEGRLMGESYDADVAEVTPSGLAEHVHGLAEAGATHVQLVLDPITAESIETGRLGAGFPGDLNTAPQFLEVVFHRVPWLSGIHAQRCRGSVGGRCLGRPMANDEHPTRPGHPIPVAVTRARAEIASVADHQTWSMTPLDVRETVTHLIREQAQREELLARVIAEGERNGAFTETGATGAVAWIAHTTHLTRGQAQRHVKLAAQLDHHDTVRDSMAAGQVHPEQAAVICQAVDELPHESRELCEKELVGLADHYDAKELKVHGRRVLAIVDPDAADAHEAKLLEREERAAAKATSLSMWDTGDGQVKGTFTLPALEGGMLKKALTALAAPKHVRANGGTYDHERPTPERLGQAFGEYVSRYPLDKLPHAGGINATVVVTMELDTLLGGLRAASIDTGTRLSAGAARRLACEAGIIPAVLDTKSRAPRPRPQGPLPHRDPTPRARDHPTALPEPRLHHPRLALPRPSHETLEPRRHHQP